MPDRKQPPPAARDVPALGARFVMNHAGVLELSDEDLLRLSSQNDHLQFEQDAQGNLVIMSPASGYTSNQNSDLVYEVEHWNRETGLGKVFGPDGGFKLPNGAKRTPDVSWIPNERWDSLSDAERETFPPMCPDFACELRSVSDTLAPLQEKMQEYMENGCRLGWLIDPFEEQALVYRPGKDVEVVSFEETLSGGDVLPGFELSLDDVLR